MKFVICCVLIATISQVTVGETLEDVVDSILESIKEEDIPLGQEYPFSPILTGSAKLSGGYNLSVKMTDTVFSSFYGSKRVTDRPVKGSRIHNFFKLDFMMETPDDEKLLGKVFTSEPHGKPSTDPNCKPPECYLTATCESHVTATVKRPIRFNVMLDIERETWGNILIRSLTFDKEPEYLTSIDSCNIHETTKCNEFAKWMDQDLLWGWNRRLIGAFQTVLKKVRVPGM